MAKMLSERFFRSSNVPLIGPLGMFGTGFLDQRPTDWTVGHGYRMFMDCSRIFSNSSFMRTTSCWMPAWLALLPVVLISRPIS